MTRTIFLLSLLALTSLACQQPASHETSSSAPEAAAAPTADSATAAEPAVEYEPAYPTDVSSEELSESDVAQQETHSHGDGEEHAHGDDDEHGEEEGDHGHQH